MKKNLIHSVLMIALAILNAACEGDSSNFKNLKDYHSSLDTWNDLKDAHGASYTYQIKTGSGFGFGTTTQITVIDNEVVSRTYESYSVYDGDTYVGYDNRVITGSYTETSENLDTHIEGASPLTIDVLYDTCFNEYLSVDTDSNSITFEVDDANVIKDCYYVPDGCQDDCTFGITIGSFEWIVTE